MEHLPTIYAAAVLLPLASFVMILLFARQLGRAASVIATGAILLAAALSFVALGLWLNHHFPDAGHHTAHAGDHADDAGHSDHHAPATDHHDKGASAKTADAHFVSFVQEPSAAHAATAEVRLYDRLFTSPDPDGGDADFTTMMNPGSLEILRDCKVEPLLAGAASGARYQFERQGYFAVDPDSRNGAPVFNRTVSLKDSWAKAAHP